MPSEVFLKTVKPIANASLGSDLSTSNAFCLKSFAKVNRSDSFPVKVLPFLRAKRIAFNSPYESLRNLLTSL